MGTITKPRPVKLIAGLLTTSPGSLLEAERYLARSFGPIDHKSAAIRFDFTGYYQKDMGPDITRSFISFQKLIEPSRLADIKIITNRIEQSLAARMKNVKRPVNIDPGYITDAKLVLASTKDFCHRIYLRKGIFAEVTLLYKDAAFRPHDLTYPDYRTGAYLEIFSSIRKLYMEQVKSMRLR